MSATKQCSKCGETKPLSEFYTESNGTPRAGCKACRRADSRRRDPVYYRTHTEAMKAKARRWQMANPERARKNSREATRRLRRRERDRGQTFLPLPFPVAHGQSPAVDFPHA